MSETENTPPLDLGELMRMHAQTATAWVISTGYRGFDPGYVIFDGSERGRVVLQSARMGASREQFLADVQFAATAHTMMPALLARLAAVEHERDTLAAQVRQLREALLTYGEHQRPCRHRPYGNTPEPCTCGLWQVQYPEQFVAALAPSQEETP